MKAISSLVAASSMLLSPPTELNVGVKGLTLTDGHNWFTWSSADRLPYKGAIPTSQDQIDALIDNYIHCPEQQKRWKEKVNPGDDDYPSVVSAAGFSVNGGASDSGQKVGFRILPGTDARIKVCYHDVRVLEGDLILEIDDIILAEDVADIKWERGQPIESAIDMYIYTVTFQKEGSTFLQGSKRDFLKFEANSRDKELWDRILRFWAGLEQPSDEFQESLNRTFPDDENLKFIYERDYEVLGCNVSSIPIETSTGTESIPIGNSSVNFTIPTKDNLILYRSHEGTRRYRSKRSEFLGEILAKDVVDISWTESGDSNHTVSFNTEGGKTYTIVLPLKSTSAQETSAQGKWDKVFRLWAGLDRVVREAESDSDATELESDLGPLEVYDSKDVVYNPVAFSSNV